jgi:outer membrane protein OmpA-like peptidoglycan-associated protein
MMVSKPSYQERHAMSAIPVSGERRITGVIEPVRFDLGKANISKSVIRQIQAALAKYTAPDPEVTVVVAGHSDNTPLSAKTAELYRDNQGHLPCSSMGGGRHYS